MICVVLRLGFSQHCVVYVLQWSWTQVCGWVPGGASTDMIAMMHVLLFFNIEQHVDSILYCTVLICVVYIVVHGSGLS